jgi:exopolysaccharide biosynthesis polyprenyl glycosylphosphotransferase
MMKVARRAIIRVLYIFIDVFCLYLSIFLACWLKQDILSFKVSFTSILIDQTNPFRVIFLIWIFSAVHFSNIYHLYQTRRNIAEGMELALVAKSALLSGFVVIIATYLLKVEDFPRSIFIISMVSTATLFSLWRLAKRLFVTYLVSEGYNNFNVLIVGAGKIGTALAREIKQRPGLGMKIVGFLDDYKMDGTATEPDLPAILGRISDFSRVARREFINKVFITVHHDSKVFLDLLEHAQAMGVAIRVVPQGFDLMTGEIDKYNIGFIPILEYCDENLKRQLGKRLFDFMAGLIFIFFLLPIYVILGILVKLDSPGSVFYKSKRYGRRGKIFYMYKFRSMVREADKILEELKDKNEADGPIFKLRQDPRVTKVGRWLRRYSLDELPQIINVLKGEMSLVGPRPLPIAQILKEDLKQLERLEVRPGITGLWQIRGRSDISFGRLVKWDIWYINNWSLWLDLNILFQTIPVVLKGRGAY